ncbi:MAG: beta-ketoacyl synthase N-terminal-like domain-containing protein [Polyangiaceae bacterium]
MATCRLASIGDQVIGIDRMLAMAAPALVQATFAWMDHQRARSQSAPPLPLVVALPSRSRPGFDARLEPHFLRALEARARVPIDHPRSQLVFGCRGGGVQAMEMAIERVRTGEVEAIAVGGVDSWFDPDALEWLDRELRLHSMENENGFIPGEGAAFLLVTSRHRAAALPRLAQLVGAGTALEPRPYGSEEPCTALGITAAVKRAVTAIGPRARRIGWTMTDVVNERHRVDEWMFVMARAHEAVVRDHVHEQPLLTTGDLGAASAGMMVAIAAARWQSLCAPADCVLLGLHSDGAERGALVVSEDPS